MINFYRNCMPEAANTQAPLNDLLHGKKGSDRLTWTDQTDEAFTRIKQQLMGATMIAHPRYDAPLTLVCDASDFAIGATLPQQTDKKSWEPLGFYSMKLCPAQQKYSAYDRELTAIYQSIKNLQHLLEGRPFTVYTDH